MLNSKEDCNVKLSYLNGDFFLLKVKNMGLWECSFVINRKHLAGLETEIRKIRAAETVVGLQEQDWKRI